MAHDSIADRIRIALDCRKMKPADLARAIGISRAAISLILSGQTKGPKPEHLVAIADVLMVDIKWIVTGRGEMRPRFPADQIDLVKRINNLADHDRAVLRAMVDALEAKSNGSDGNAGESAA